MDKEFTINNQDLLDNLLALALMCYRNDTDNCDLTITTDRGAIICHIEFEGRLAESED